jgi:hypothetical protein
MLNRAILISPDCSENRNRNSTTSVYRLFGAGRVLGDGLGAFRDGVLGKLTWQDEADTGTVN